MPDILGHEYFSQTVIKLVLSRIQLNYQRVDNEKHIIYNYFIEVKRLSIVLRPPLITYILFIP